MHSCISPVYYGMHNNALKDVDEKIYGLDKMNIV